MGYMFAMRVSTRVHRVACIHTGCLDNKFLQVRDSRLIVVVYSCPDLY